MRITIFEGTPEEYIQIAPHLPEEVADGHVRVTRASESNDTASVRASDGDDATMALIRKALTRIDLSQGQRDALRVIAAADNTPISAADLAAQINQPIDKLWGILGGLGQRINKTPGADKLQVKGINVMFDVKRDANGYTYRLRLPSRTVLEQEGII